MLELLRTFLGYCQNCRRPTIVGEFKIAGWQHVFNLCSMCLQKRTDELIKAEGDVASRMQETGSRI